RNFGNTSYIPSQFHRLSQRFTVPYRTLHFAVQLVKRFSSRQYIVERSPRNCDDTGRVADDHITVSDCNSPYGRRLTNRVEPDTPLATGRCYCPACQPEARIADVIDVSASSVDHDRGKPTRRGCKSRHTTKRRYLRAIHIDHQDFSTFDG